MRNLFVGSLCAIGMFMLCCRGYDRKDEIAGVFSAFCALGVAFFPTARIAAQRPAKVTLGLRITSLPYFCFRRSPISVLCLFKMSAANKTMTPKKVQKKPGCTRLAGM